MDIATYNHALMCNETVVDLMQGALYTLQKMYVISTRFGYLSFMPYYLHN